jgi:hypothetical protein
MMPKDSIKYAFRISCFVAGGDIETEEPEIQLDLPGLHPIQVYVSERKDDSEDLTVWCSGFSSAAEAHAAGMRVKTAFMLAGILLGVGIDVGNDQAVGPQFTRADGQKDERLQPEVHGLQVVPDIEGLFFGSLRFGRAVTRITPANFQKRVAESYALRKTLTKKQILAAQLYNQSHFHSFDAVRFLTLISAVECLIEPSLRSPATVQLVERMIQLDKASLNEEESESLNSGLRNLKSESIGSTCRTLVRTHCGDSSAKAFRRMYDIRSKLLHNGEPPPGTDFDVEVGELDILVRKLLVRNLST